MFIKDLLKALPKDIQNSTATDFRFVLGLQEQPIPADSPLTNILNCHRADNCLWLGRSAWLTTVYTTAR